MVRVLFISFGVGAIVSVFACEQIQTKEERKTVCARCACYLFFLLL